MSPVSANDVRQFLLTRYSDHLKALRLNPDEVSDDFDFLLTGVVDSFGILEMLTAIENEFQVHLDLATLDAQQISIVGPLSSYVAANAMRQVARSP